MSTTTHPTSLEARVARLEAAGRRWRWACAVLGAVVLGLGVAAAGPKGAPKEEKIPEVVRARRFEVIGKDQTKLAELYSDKGEGYFRLNTSEGKGAVFVSATKQRGGAMAINSADETPCVMLFSTNGEGAMGIFGLHRGDYSLMKLHFDKSGGQVLLYNMEKEKAVWTLEGEELIPSK